MRFNRGVVASVFTALVAVMLGGLFDSALAQSSFYPKRVPLLFVRNSQGADNALGATQPTYLSPIANGSHGAATAGGIYTAIWDTSSAVFVGDHWLKASPVSRAGQVATPNLLADSSWFCTLILKTNSSTFDTVTVARDYSQDGITWTVVDSGSVHTVSAQSNLDVSIGGDSLKVILAGVTSPAGTVATAGSLTFTANPGFTTSGVTGQASLGVNFVRFRVHGTHGDLVAASNTRGLTAEMLYPAVDANANQPQRYNP